MINVFDFCKACTEATTVKLSFFDINSDDFIGTVILSNAKTAYKTLSAVCGYSYIEYFYISADIICAKVRVHACDL